MEPELRRAVEKQQKILTLTWLGAIAALFLYLLLPRFFGPRRLPEVEQPYHGFRMILWIVAVIEVVSLLWWSRTFLTKEAVLRAVQGTGVDPLIYYSGRKISAIAIAQSVAVYGLVLAFVGRYFWDQYILTLVSGVLLVRHRPSRSFCNELAKEIEGRR